MRFFCIACEVLARTIYQAAADSPHTVDIRLFSLGKHNEPKQLNAILQNEIDTLERANYDAILVGYGLCGNWLTSLSTRSIPLVFPKMHDCISMFLGDTDLYLQKMKEEPGTYWFTRDFIERSILGDSFIPLGTASVKIFGNTANELIGKYGEENSRYLMQMARDWQKYYRRVIWIEPENGTDGNQEAQAKKEANTRGWQFEKLPENPVWIHALLNGKWMETSQLPFFIVPPRSTVSLSYDEQFFRLDSPSEDKS